MNESELVQKVRAGEKDAFEKWMDIYSGDIERFAIQYGCAFKQAADIAEETFRKLHNQVDSIGNEQALVCTLYKNTLKSIAYIQQTDPQNETIFPFEEDQGLHDQIVNFEMEHKVPFILSQFHKLGYLEIATIMNSSLEEVQQAITVVSSQLEGTQLEKRLEFLNKSYRRMKPSFRKEQVFAKPEQEIQATGKLKQSMSKKAMISWIAGILVLLSLVIVPIVTGEEYKKASAEKYVERLKESFEQEIESRYSELGLTEPTEVDKLDYNYPWYGKSARADFKSMIARYEGVIAKTGTLNKKMIEDEYGKIIEKLKLPSEMVNRLFENPLANDKVKSEEFMKGYLEQVDSLQQAYYTMIIKHEQVIADAIANESVAADTFTQKKDTYPEELQLALDGMIKQNIYPTYIKGKGGLGPVYGKNSFSAKVRSSIHEDFVGFFTVLESAPFLSFPGLTHSLEESVTFLLEIEKTLLATTINDEKTGMLSGTYSQLFYEIVGGAEPNQVFDVDGKVKKEFHEAWKRIESAGEGSPASYFMRAIRYEREAEDWNEPKNRNPLQAYQLQRVLELVKEGEFNTSSVGGIRQSAAGIESVAFPNPYFEIVVEDTYNSFIASGHHQSVLQGVNPLVIMGVYFYANDNGDPETMWHLSSVESKTATSSEYVNGWSKSAIDINSFDSLQIDGSELIAGSIGFQRGNKITYSAQMILNDESVWGIGHIDIDTLLVQ